MILTAKRGHGLSIVALLAFLRHSSDYTKTTDVCLIDAALSVLQEKYDINYMCMEKGNEEQQ